MRDADVFGLAAVDGVAEDPASVPAMGVHPLLAEVALAAGGDARDQDLVALADVGDGAAHLVDDADPFVSEDPARGHRRDVAFEDVQVRPADGGGRDPHDGVGGLSNHRARLVFPGTPARTVINEGLHRGHGHRLGGVAPLPVLPGRMRHHRGLAFFHEVPLSLMWQPVALVLGPSPLGRHTSRWHANRSEKRCVTGSVHCAHCRRGRGARVGPSRNCCV